MYVFVSLRIRRGLDAVMFENWKKNRNGMHTEIWQEEKKITSRWVVRDSIRILSGGRTFT